MRTQSSQVTAQDHRVGVDDADHIINSVAQRRAGTLEYLQHRSVTFLDRLNDELNRLAGSLVD
jgi:hypothetical protein